ncbi:MAG: hypothetical protein JST21_00675 [Bacteroidetes bacterium]|nr:hypothetical protein [Bacteroidota bacterium]
MFTRKFHYNAFVITVLLVVFSTVIKAQFSGPCTDTTHYSKVFDHEKYYRIYLPNDYYKTEKRYPVIYFFHGWGGRYFKDDNALINYEGLQRVVDSLHLILVMWDGNIDTLEPRPYNEGEHKDIKYQVQMKDYLPELVNHIDSTYRTLTDRQHRGMIGFSMGGFMSLFLAGKYPDMFTAAVSFAGSPEFFIGYPDNQTFYKVRYLFGNLFQIHFRQYNGETDILHYLNEEVRAGAEWQGYPLQYISFHGGHMIDATGETKRFGMAMHFIDSCFKLKPIVPYRWSHLDLYADFDVWDYHVSSAKNKPGWIYLRNVDKNGFDLSAKKWLPTGPDIEIDSLRLQTAPLYIPGKQMKVVMYNKQKKALSETTQVVDKDGRLSFYFKQFKDPVSVGIYDEDDKPSLVCTGYEIDKGKSMLHSPGSQQISFSFFNHGALPKQTRKITVQFFTNDKDVQISKNELTFSLTPQSRIFKTIPITITSEKSPPPHAEPSEIRFSMKFSTSSEKDDKAKEDEDEVIIPVLYEAPLFDSIQIDDGRIIRDSAFGTGNGNGIPEAGEKILVYCGNSRLRLYTDDPWVIREKETIAIESLPAKWPDGFSLSSVVAISPDCPKDHVITFYGDYETKTYDPIERKLHWGEVKLKVGSLP